MAVESPPIIIKKIKKGGHGHHGGAWKVAFADFVTAMMAFFMLMWLMGSTTPQQKQAISQYMNNPVAASGQGGAGANPVLDGGDGILDGQGPSTFAQAAPSEATTTAATPAADAAEQIAAQAELARMEDMRKELLAAVDASEALKPFKDQLLLDLTSEGLRIQIVDKENRAMFAQGSPVLENYMRELLHEVAKVVSQVPNRISISGHTDQTPYASKNGYSNWELSSDRANAARRELIAGGFNEDKIGRVVGLASSVLFDKENPFGPINRRISIVVMKKAADTAANAGEGQPLVQSSDPLATATAGVSAEAPRADATAAPATTEVTPPPITFPAGPAATAEASAELPTPPPAAAVPASEPVLPETAPVAPPSAPPKVRKIVKIAIAPSAP